MRSAIIHDWLISPIGGAEKVLQAIHSLFPSPIYTLVKNEKGLEGSYFQDLEIVSSFIQKLPRSIQNYKRYLPLFPLAVEHFNLKEYDLIVSSSHCAAKGVITSPDQLHICYCHTPMRYAWDLMHDYLKESKLERGVKGFLAKFFLHYLRGWDVHSAHRVDHFIANSQYVAKRIAKFYSKKAEVIYPFVDLDHFQKEEKKEGYYVTASRLVPYKRVDLIVEAFTQMPDRKLIVIGDGPHLKQIKQMATQNIEILGAVSDELLKKVLQKAKAFIFAAVEDFGIVPVEAMASGTAVIAFQKGGICETVVDQKTGLFYKEQSSQAILEAVQAFEKMEIDPNECRKQAELFSRKRFEEHLTQFIQGCL